MLLILLGLVAKFSVAFWSILDSEAVQKYLTGTNGISAFQTDSEETQESLPLGSGYHHSVYLVHNMIGKTRFFVASTADICRIKIPTMSSAVPTFRPDRGKAPLLLPIFLANAADRTSTATSKRTFSFSEK